MILGVKLDFFVLVIHGNLPSYHGLKLHSNHIADDGIVALMSHVVLAPSVNHVVGRIQF